MEECKHESKLPIEKMVMLKGVLPLMDSLQRSAKRRDMTDNLTGLGGGKDPAYLFSNIGRVEEMRDYLKQIRVLTEGLDSGPVRVMAARTLIMCDAMFQVPSLSVSVSLCDSVSVSSLSLSLSLCCVLCVCVSLSLCILKSETPDCQYSIYPCLESAGISNTAP